MTKSAVSGFLTQVPSTRSRGGYSQLVASEVAAACGARIARGFVSFLPARFDPCTMTARDVNIRQRSRLFRSKRGDHGSKLSLTPVRYGNAVYREYNPNTVAAA